MKELADFFRQFSGRDNGECSALSEAYEQQQLLSIQEECKMQKSLNEWKRQGLEEARLTLENLNALKGKAPVDRVVTLDAEDIAAQQNASIEDAFELQDKLRAVLDAQWKHGRDIIQLRTRVDKLKSVKAKWDKHVLDNPSLKANVAEDQRIAMAELEVEKKCRETKDKMDVD